MLRYDLRIIAFAVMHVTIPIMYSDIGRPTANHDKVGLRLGYCIAHPYRLYDSCLQEPLCAACVQPPLRMLWCGWLASLLLSPRQAPVHG